MVTPPSQPLTDVDEENDRKRAISNAPSFADEIEHLRREYLRPLLWGIMAVAWLALQRAFQVPSEGFERALLVPLALGLGGALAFVLLSRRTDLAIWILLVALVAANMLELWTFPDEIGRFAPILIVFLAAFFTSTRGMLAVATLALAVLAAYGVFGPMPLSLRDLVPSLFLVLLATFFALVGTRQFHTVLGWAWNSTRQAIAAAAQAQADRAELARLNKELDSAYIRLDRLNRMLILAHQEAEEARMLKVQFANAVSHELRSPLNLIIGFSEMMVNSPEVYGPQPWPPRLKHHILQIYQSSQHLSQLIDDVLDMARIDAYRLTLNKERSAIAEVIAEAVEIVRSLYDARKLALRVEAPADLPRVSIDRTRIRQVLLNLLTNALRFTENGGVTVTAAMQGDELVVTVADTGIGIAPEDLPKLFQEFRQLDGSFYRWQRGSGLGLAISRQLIEQHGGRIWAESAPGQGSRFSFALPLDGWTANEPLQESPGTQQFWEYLEEKAHARRPLLVYADDAAQQRWLATHLSAFDVTWKTDNADLAPTAADVHPFAVIHVSTQPGAWTPPLLDVARALRDVPVIACSLPGLARPAALVGLTDYLVKPVSRRKLANALDRLGREIHSVLIVEDDDAMREYLVTALTTLYPQSRCLEASRGAQALAAAAECAPDAVLLDLTLPDMEGAEVAARLADITQGRTPIIAVTARDVPVEQEPNEPDVVCCLRQARFGQRELDRLLNGLLDALAPPSSSLAQRGAPRAEPPANAGAGPASSRSAPPPAPTPGRRRPTLSTR